MKKTLIAILALSGLAMAEGVTYSETLTLTTTSTYWGKGNSRSGDDDPAHWSNSTANDGIAADYVYYDFIAAPNATTGMIYYGVANGNDYGSGDVVISTAADKSISFNTLARGANGGEYVALTLSKEDLTIGAHTIGDTLVEVTLTFTNNVEKGAYSAWGYTKGATSVTNLGGVQNTASGENTLTLTESDLMNVDKLVFVIGNAKNNTQVTGLSVVSTFKTPEPATATLSLLALAGLASRRRRH